MPRNEAQEANDENQNQALELHTSTSTARTKLMERGQIGEDMYDVDRACNSMVFAFAVALDATADRW
jgi:hypothetical protein